LTSRGWLAALVDDFRNWGVNSDYFATISPFY
jgi:hypothetical protein